ncbi:MAG TPA: U32 family peptidase [Bacteriovoracaceae bacterium]|nr:U32 family peptidase [Bacteriovoracaceae bacterium]
MRPTTYAQNLHDLGVLKSEGFEEVILEHRSFSRFGQLSDEAFIEMATRAKELGLRVLLEWDILMTQTVFSQKVKAVSGFLNLVDAVRVQDPGALEWMLTNTTKPLQFIAENGNHNLSALTGWIEHAQGRMERIVLSIELSKATIQTYLKEISIPCELLGLGRILLFYTPRSLLSALTPLKSPVNQEFSAVAESEESPHKGFPVVENQHGTFMFHIKEFSLLEYARELEQMGMGFLRLDLRWQGARFVPPVCALVRNFEQQRYDVFKQEYPQDLMRGFYLVNKTDVLFPKLKNTRLQKREGDYAGEVLEAVKGSHLAIMVKNSRGLRRCDRLKILHPEGKTFEVDIFSLRNLALEEVDTVPAQQLALIPFVGGVWSKSQVFYLG